MNIKGIFQKVLREFTLDDKGNPVYPPNNSDRYDEVLSSRGYKSLDTLYGRNYKRDGGRKVHVGNDGFWLHEYDDKVQNTGGSAESLQKHLDRVHN